MTSSARQTLQEVLAPLFDGAGHLSFLQNAPTEVKEIPDPSFQWKKCVDGKENCGLLHDTMSLQWGKFKDLVDELEDEMSAKADGWEERSTNLNSQMTSASAEKGRCQEALNAAISSKNTLVDETGTKG